MDGARASSNPAPDPSASAWAALSVRRFRWLLYAVGALFVATEGLALSGLVPLIQPLSLPEIAGDS